MDDNMSEIKFLISFIPTGITPLIWNLSNKTPTICCGNEFKIEVMSLLSSTIFHGNNNPENNNKLPTVGGGRVHYWPDVDQHVYMVPYGFRLYTLSII